jgi:aminoglycoside phosphotransferase (APT) family kinase protein
MPRGSLESIAADPVFPALKDAAGANHLLGALAEAGVIASPLAKALLIDVLNHKPGRRCTVRYQLETPDGRLDVIGKWYREPARARELHGLHEALCASGLRLPRPLGASSDGLLIEEFVDGRELRELASESDSAPFAAAGRWLAALQAVSPPAGLLQKSQVHEMAKAEGWAMTVRSGVPEWGAALAETLSEMRRLADRLEPVPYVLMHRDYYPANLLWDGVSLWGIDFDQMAIGDAAVDPATFLAQLDKVAIRDGVPRDVFYAHAAAFLDAYSGGRDQDLGFRLPFFKAYTFLKVAAAEVERCRPRWRELAEAYLGRARESARRVR